MDPNAKIRARADLMAQLRRDLEPPAHSPGAVEQQCQTCPATFWRRKGDHRPICAQCKADRQVAATVSMSNRQGEVYERAAVRQYEYWRGECIRLGLIPAGDGE